MNIIPETIPWKFQLFICAGSSLSLSAIDRIQRLCEQHLKDQYALEIIDIHEHPGRAEAARIIAVPALIRSHPHPRKVFIGQMQSLEAWFSTSDSSARIEQHP